MRLGPYTASFEGLRTLARIAGTRLGRPAMPRRHGDPVEIARAVLRSNGGPVLSAGAHHFRAMWTADTGTAFAGALLELERGYLEPLVARMLRASARAGRVPVCFTARSHADVPWPRVDGAPWLIRMTEQLGERFAQAHETEARRVYERWASDHIDARTGLLAHEANGDWMDTAPRPSSTFSNVAALHAHGIAARWGWPDAPMHRARALDALLAERWREDHFVEDGSGVSSVGVDAHVLAMYFGDLPRDIRQAAARKIEALGLAAPVPLRARASSRMDDLPLTRMAGKYHEATWTHLGWMFCIGLEKLGIPSAAHAAKLERLVHVHGTFVETLDENGDPLETGWMRTEVDFTMSAGLYLEWRDLVQTRTMPR